MAKEHISESVREVEGSKSISGDTTILTRATATISFGSISKVFSLLVNNDSTASGYDITLTLNGDTTRAVKAGESFSISDFEITSILITNSSGSTVSYRYFAVGE
jgi:hypothetical protein